MSAVASLTAEQEAHAQQMAEKVLEQAREEILQMMRLLVSKEDSQLLGQTEHQLRQRAHAIAAGALQTALSERKKGGTKAHP